MLVLSRKMGERVFIDDDIEILVIEVRGGKVKLGFAAPTSHVIQRSEVAPRGFNSETTPPRKDSTAGVSGQHNLYGGG